MKHKRQQEQSGEYACYHDSCRDDSVDYDNRFVTLSVRRLNINLLAEIFLKCLQFIVRQIGSKEKACAAVFVGAVFFISFQNLHPLHKFRCCCDIRKSVRNNKIIGKTYYIKYDVAFIIGNDKPVTDIYTAVVFGNNSLAVTLQLIFCENLPSVML